METNKQREFNQTHLQNEAKKKQGQNFMKPTQINKWKLFSNFLAEREA